MPLSEHEQRMLDQIESALYAEDPKFASSVRGVRLGATSGRRRLQGALLFCVGLALLVVGVAVPSTQLGHFPVLSVIGFVVMFGAAVFAIIGVRGHGSGSASDSSERGTLGRVRRAGGTGSFAQRMEERFRRRFDG